MEDEKLDMPCHSLLGSREPLWKSQAPHAHSTASYMALEHFTKATWHLRPH